jgi:hypothetical protein
MEAFTPRNVAKFIAQAAIAAKTSSLTKTAITDHTKFEEDDMIVDISGHLVGWYVSDKLKPVTDGMVDKAADWIAVRRAKKDQKKTDPPSE